ncbi:MAG: GNAT family N-acetyltransferase [Clostridia bacterium]|nr:GNAT family N-acetyltransferase [Clostridia bacterium]
MDNLILISPNETMYDEIAAYRNAMQKAGSSMDGTSGLNNYENPAEWLAHVRALQKEETCPPHLVTATLFVCVRQIDDRIVGMIDVRHRLNEFLAEYGGHIGYSVRPEERRKGYAKHMLSLALQEARKLSIPRVLITCDEDNIASARTIEANGGTFERLANLDGEILRRYWIEL